MRLATPWHLTAWPPASAIDADEALHTCAIPCGHPVRSASGLSGAAGDWMDPRSGLVGATTKDGGHFMTGESSCA